MSGGKEHSTARKVDTMTNQQSDEQRRAEQEQRRQERERERQEREAQQGQTPQQEQ